MNSDVFSILSSRGFVAQSSHEELPAELSRRPLTLYCGFDPTADSLHLGHMVPIMALSHFQKCGHRVLVVVGGATGMVGDPSGRSSERQLLGPEAIRRNVAAIKTQLSKFLSFEGDNAAVMLDNNDWIGPMSFVDWLREVGKFFSVSNMLAKESVQKRMESERGLSFTEFSYMTMQAFDFLHLFDTHRCSLQVGGTDQWGNITAGFDLIRKVRGKSAFGLTFPLVTTSAGEKFGKSAGNAVWLDARRTSPFRFFQFWLQVADADVEQFLKFFTFCELDHLSEVCAQHRRDPEARLAQRLLATEMTRLVHGDTGLATAERATAILFGSGSPRDLPLEEMQDVFADVPSSQVSRALLRQGLLLPELLVSAGISTSKTEARRLLEQGAVNLNGDRVTEFRRIVGENDLLGGGFLFVRIGKKRNQLIQAAA